MAMMKPLDVFFLDEWDRLKQGFAGLDPGGGVGPAARARHIDPAVAGTGTITIPGWNQIIKGVVVVPQGGTSIAIPGTGVGLTFGRDPKVGSKDFGDYYRDLRSGKAPTQDPALKAQVQKILATSAAQKTTTQPGYSLAIGQIMTAIDNSQDLIATIATLGRLAIWAFPRIGLRAVPVVGWIVLAADILNLFNFVGMVATPLYSLLCAGPRDAIAAGVPAAVLKNALCKEAWTTAHLNPFSKAARATRGLRALGRLPGVSNWIELLQVTDNLFGVGISLGALYGTAMETLYAGTTDVPFSGATLNTNIVTGSLGAVYKAKVLQQSEPEQKAAVQAARLLQMAPIIAGQHDMFDDDTHLQLQMALVAASSIMAKFFDGGPHQELMRELLPGNWPAPARRPEYLDVLRPGITDDDAGIGRWWIEGNPRSMPGDPLVMALAKPCIEAVTTFLKPRRNEPRMTFYGATINQTTDHLWTLIGGDAECLKWKLQPDFVILTSMMVEGLLVGQATALGPLWRFWLDLRAQVEARDGRMLERNHIEDAERRAGITLLRLLPVQAPFPPAWDKYFRDPDGFTTQGPGSWPGILSSGRMEVPPY